MTAHCSLLTAHYLPDQIVLVRLGDADVDEVAGAWHEAFGRVVNEDAAVDVGRLRLGATLPEQVGLLRGAFKEDAHGLARARAVAPPGNLTLLPHQEVAAARGHFGINFVGQVEGGRALLVRVGEDADAVELDV